MVKFSEDEQSNTWEFFAVPLAAHMAEVPYQCCALTD